MTKILIANGSRHQANHFESADMTVYQKLRLKIPECKQISFLRQKKRSKNRDKKSNKKNK